MKNHGTCMDAWRSITYGCLHNAVTAASPPQPPMHHESYFVALGPMAGPCAPRRTNSPALDPHTLFPQPLGATTVPHSSLARFAYHHGTRNAECAPACACAQPHTHSPPRTRRAHDERTHTRALTWKQPPRLPPPPAASSKGAAGGGGGRSSLTGCRPESGPASPAPWRGWSGAPCGLRP